MSKANWREEYRPGDVCPWVHIRSDEGKWVWPDCSYRCPYCGACLGCVRKFYDAPLLADHFDCPKSPDGDHHLIEDAGKN